MDQKTLKTLITEFEGIIVDFKSLTKDDAAQIFSSAGAALNNYSYFLSLNLMTSSTKNNYLKLSPEEKESPEGIILGKILSIASVIEQNAFRANNVFNKVIHRLRSSPIEFITDQEVQELSKELVGQDVTPSEFILDDELLYNRMKQLLCTNAAIKSGLFTKGATFNTVR